MPTRQQLGRAAKKLATPAPCRASRALLGWTPSRLAEAASVARKTIADLELRNRTLRDGAPAGITAVLERRASSSCGKM
jgi:DNA-binding XRE family transcriptional regulator